MLSYGRLGHDLSPAQAALYYAQRLVPVPCLRHAIASAVAAGIGLQRPKKDPSPRGSPKDPTQAIAKELRTSGFALIPNQLAPAQIEEMRAYLATQPLVLRSGETVAMDRIPEGTTIADYSLDTVLHCPHMLALMNAPDLIALARRFLGCAPTISTIGIRWSFPGRRSEATTQGFHRDPDDWRFFKFFVYLSDVDAGCGPHLYVRGSNRTLGTFRAIRLEEEAVTRRYGRVAIVTIAGPRGTNFVADTYGVHAGPIPTTSPRLMLEVGYSVLPVFAIRYQPLVLEPRPAVDPYINRLLIAPL